MACIQEKLLSKAEEWSLEPIKIREKLKANCTPALKRNDSGKRPGPLVAKHTSDIQLPFGSSCIGVQDKTRRSCRTPSPSSNTNEFTFLNKPVTRRPISPPVCRSRRRSPVQNRSRSPSTIPLGGLRRIPSPAGSLDNLQVEAIKKKVKKVQRARLYLLQRPGPNSLLIAGDSPEHKYKVIIGPQTCSCGRGPHCIHILFVMLRVFQVSENDPTLFVKDLKNFEVEALFRKYDEKRNKHLAVKPSSTANSLRASSESTLNNKGLDISIGSRSSSMNDIQHSVKDEEQWCPICLLEMLDGESLVTCVSGCKNKLHHHCIVIWSDECKRQNEPVLCPLCRAIWTWPEGESKTCKDSSTSTSLSPPSALACIGHTNYISSSSSPSSPLPLRDNISSLSPVLSLPSDVASSSLSSLPPSSSSSTASVHSENLTDSSKSTFVRTLPNLSFHGQHIADNCDEWAKTFGEAVVTGIRSPDWTIREITLRQLCTFVVTSLSQYANEETIPSTTDSHPTTSVVNACCSILSVVAADPVYRVYISCLRCLRALLACSACRSNSDLVKLQEQVRPVVEAIILKCADGNRRTSQLSAATLIELCRGSSGELAVGRQTRFLAENGLGGVAYVLSCILTVPDEMITLKWQWFLSRLYALDRLMEEFPQEFYLLYVEKLAKDLGCYHHCASRLVNYDRLMSVLLFSVKGFGHSHATVRKISRRVFIVAARLTSHVQGVFTQVCDMLAPVDAALQAKLKHRLCAVRHKSETMSEVKHECGAKAEVNDSKVIYTSVQLPSRRHSFGRNTPSSPTQLPDRSLILEKLGKDLFVCCDCSSPKRTRPPSRLQRSASYTPSLNSPLDLRNKGLTSHLSSSALHENSKQGSSAHIQERHGAPLQRPNFLPLPASNWCNQDILENSSYSCVRMSPAVNQPSRNAQCDGVIPQCTYKSSYHPPSLVQQQFHPSQLQRSITRRSSDPVSSSSQCPVGDLIDLSIPVPSEVPRTGFSQLSFKSEIVTPTTPVNTKTASEKVCSANQTALQRQKEVVYEEAVLLMKSLTKLSLQPSLPTIPGLTDIPFDSTRFDYDYDEKFNSADTKKEVNYTEGVHWIRGPLLGTGAFSSCFQARDIKTGTLMAVKQISLCCTSTDSQNSKMENIHEEIMMMTKLDHPNVVRLMGATQQGSYYNMFVEWMPGGSVAALLDRYGPFTEDVMVRYLHQVLAGLAYLHEKQILHRDLKGANLLVDSTGHYLRIGDFGAAARLASQRTVADEFKGQLLGTIAFMAPEVLRGEGYGRSSDVWSIGCIIIEMSTTKPPWDAVNISNDLALLFKIACSHGPPPIPESLPPGIRDIALRCLEQNSGDRPPAKELLHHACFSVLNEQAGSELKSCSQL